MRYLAIVLFLLQVLCFQLQAQSNTTELIQWYPSFNEGLIKANQNSSKLILLDVYTHWCGPCKSLSRNLNHPEVAKVINQYFHPVKFNAEGNEKVHFLDKGFINQDFDPNKTQGRNATHPFAFFIASVQGRLGYPTLVFLKNDGKEHYPVPGVFEPQELIYLLYYMAENHYKKMGFPQFKKENAERLALKK